MLIVFYRVKNYIQPQKFCDIVNYESVADSFVAIQMHKALFNEWWYSRNDRQSFEGKYYITMAFYNNHFHNIIIYNLFEPHNCFWKISRTYAVLLCAYIFFKFIQLSTFSRCIGFHLLEKKCIVTCRYVRQFNDAYIISTGP